MNYDDILSTVFRHTSIGVMLAVVTCQDLDLEQLDFETFFFDGELEEEI